MDTIGLIEEKKINPGAIVSHILGLNAYADTIFAMERPSGAKKVCYTGLDIPYIAVDELAVWGEKDPLYKTLSEIVAAHDGLWCAEAEKYLLANAKAI